jgi:hypothetical protein
MHVKDQKGNIFVLKKPVMAIDPSIPTLVKVPNEPVPRSWAKTIQTLEQVQEESTSPLARYVEGDPMQMDLKQFGGEFLGIMMDPPLVGTEPGGYVTCEQLVHVVVCI